MCLISVSQFVGSAMLASPELVSFSMWPFFVYKLTQQEVFLAFLSYITPQCLNLKAKHLLLLFFEFIFLWGRIARENTRYPVISEFQISDKKIFSVSMSQILHKIY